MTHHPLNKDWKPVARPVRNGSALLDQSPCVSQEQAARDLQAMERLSCVDRKHARLLRELREARLLFVKGDPVEAIRTLHDNGRSFDWIASTLALTREETWSYYRGETP